MPVLTIIPVSLLPIVKKMVKHFTRGRPTATELLALTKLTLFFDQTQLSVKESKEISEDMETEYTLLFIFVYLRTPV